MMTVFIHIGPGGPRNHITPSVYALELVYYNIPEHFVLLVIASNAGVQGSEGWRVGSTVLVPAL